MASVTEQLKDLAGLLEKGLITREHFDQQRDSLLSGTAPDLSGSTRMATPAGPDLSGTTRVEAPSALPPQLGSYRVIEIIGEGGMGQVVRARHIESSCALFPSLSPRAAAAAHASAASAAQSSG